MKRYNPTHNALAKLFDAVIQDKTICLFIPSAGDPAYKGEYGMICALRDDSHYPFGGTISKVAAERERLPRLTVLKIEEAARLIKEELVY